MQKAITRWRRWRRRRSIKEVDAAVDAAGEVMAAAAAMEEEYDCPSELPRRAAHALCPTPPLPPHCVSVSNEITHRHNTGRRDAAAPTILRALPRSQIQAWRSIRGIGMVRCLRRMSTAIRSIRSRALLSPTIT